MSTPAVYTLAILFVIVLVVGGFLCVILDLMCSASRRRGTVIRYSNFQATDTRMQC